MVVLTAGQVAAVLHKELAAHGSKARGKKERLVRFDRSHSRPVWGSDIAAFSLVDWREFWASLENCGRPGWPQLIRLSARFVRARDSCLSSRVVATLLREAAADTPAIDVVDADEPLGTLEPNAGGTYQITPALAGTLSEPGKDAIDDEDRNDQVGDHRQIVFIDARALCQTR
jgi:hypothetical protein